MPTEKNKLTRTLRTKPPHAPLLSPVDNQPAHYFHASSVIQGVDRHAVLHGEDAHLRLFIETAPVAIAMLDRDMRYLAVSGRWLSDYGMSGQKVVGRSHYEIFPEIPERWRKHHQRALAGEIVRQEEDRFSRSDGSTQWLRWELHPWFKADNEVGGLIIFTEDVTHRRTVEQLLRNANRTLRVIRDCHEAILRATNEPELLNDICRIIVETGGERMVWIGFAEHDARKTVRPVAWAGHGKSYVLDARVTWGDEPRGHGPMGTAIRTEQISVCRDILHDPEFAPWRAGARKLGYGSVIAFPLIVENRCLGALALYDRETNAFDTGEQQLLMDLTNDLAFGIAMLRLRDERKRLEREAVESIEREQARLGRDLHDGLCQSLVVAKFGIAYLERLIGKQFPKAVAEARSLEDLINQGIQQARDMVRGLNPVRRAPDGLEIALHKLAASVAAHSGLHCFCHFPQSVRVANHDLAVHVYRIAQEAVQNAVKHARAKNISISLVRRAHRLTLAVKDDGIGVPLALKQSGMGFENMRTRADLIGGKLEIRRRQSGGTSVKCEWSN